MSTPPRFAHTRGSTIIGIDGDPIRFRGICIGGWLNMENFITGFTANEALMRSGVLDVLGQERYQLFFDRLLSNFFGDEDAAFLASIGVNSVRIPLNYRHLEDDADPFVVKEDGFRHLDRAIATCAANGIFTIIDLHAVPGRKTNTGTQTMPPTGRCSGNSASSRTGPCTSGKRSPTTTRTRCGWRATTS